MAMRMPGPVVFVRIDIDGDGNDIDLGMGDRALGGNRIAELLDRACLATQDRHLKAVVVIEMDVERRHLQIVERVVDFRQSKRQFARVMEGRSVTGNGRPTGRDGGGSG